MFPLHDENPTRRVAWITYGLIGLCTVIFLCQLAFDPTGEQAPFRLGFVPAAFFGTGPYDPQAIPAPLTLLTTLFLHGGFLHLAGNMLFLWVFGDNVEDAMGRARFIFFYVVCGVAAALFQGILAPQSAIPLVGASGAISGVLAAYLLFYPFARVLVVIPIGFILYPTRLSSYWVLGTWFLIQIAMALITPSDSPGVAWWAHFGGFAVGLALTPFLRQPGVPLLADTRFIPKGPWARALTEADERARRNDVR